MNIQLEARKALNWILSQPPVFRILLLVLVTVFIIIPFSIPAAVIYLVWSAFKSKDQTVS